MKGYYKDENHQKDFYYNKEIIMKYRVLIEQDEDGIYVAECPSLPGCISQGKTRGEALLNIQDAIKGYLESLKKHNEPIPPPLTGYFSYLSGYEVILGLILSLMYFFCSS